MVNDLYRRNIPRVCWLNFAWMFLIIQPVTVPFFVSRKLAMTDVFAVLAAFSITLCVLDVPAGYLCDLIGRKRTLVLASALKAAGGVLLCFAVGGLQMAAVFVLIGVANSLFSGADVALLYESLEALPPATQPDPAALMGRRVFYALGGTTVSALAGGAIAGCMSLETAIIANAAFATVPLVISLTLIDAPRSAPPRGAHLKNLTRLCRDLFVRSGVLRSVVIATVLYSAAPVLSVYVYQAFWKSEGLSLALFGVLTAAFSLAGASVGRIAHYVESWLGAAGAVVLIGVLPVVGFLGPVWLPMGAAVSLGALLEVQRGLGQAVLGRQLNSRISSDMRATANSVTSFGSRVFVAAAGPVLGGALERWGASGCLVGLGVLYLGVLVLSGLLLACQLRTARHRRSPPHIVFLESNAIAGLEAMRLVREHLGAEVTFITCNLDYYKGGVDGGIRVKEVQRSDGWAALRQIVKQLNAEHPINAFMTFMDNQIIASAEVARKLGLRHISLRAAQNARNKYRARQMMAKKKVPQPVFDRVRNIAEALAFVAKHGYPIFAKPVDGTASKMSREVPDEPSLRAYFADLECGLDYGLGIKPCGQVILEEVLRGPLVSVEMVTVDGHHHLLGITDRHLSRPNCVEIGGSFPVQLEEQENVIGMVRQALDALQIDFGPTHTELILTPSGPRIVEVNPRLAGGVVYDMIDATLGRRILLDIVRLHLGEPFEPPALPCGVATIQAFYVDREGELLAVEPSPRAQDRRILRYQIRPKTGERVFPLRDNDDRLGFVVVWEKDIDASRQLAREIFEETRFMLK